MAAASSRHIEVIEPKNQTPSTSDVNSTTTEAVGGSGPTVKLTVTE